MNNFYTCSKSKKFYRIALELFTKFRFTPVFLLFAICVQATSAGYAQRITLEEKNAPIDKVFKLITKQTGYKFLFTDAMLQAARPVTVRVKNASITEVLNKCFDEQPLTYIIDNTTVVVKRKAPNLPQTSSSARFPIRGKVVDEKGLPLIGVTVRIKDSSLGVQTDTNGQYSIEVPENGTLIFSFIGFETREVTIKGNRTINIILIEQSGDLSEVVVVAYGTQKKVTVTGALTTVKGEELAKSPVANLAQTLVGRTSGVMAQQTSGEPGNDAVSLRIRGSSTLGSSAPLVLVDGVERPLNNINPEEVDNITVLKDASTTAVYGIRGANGVILVTTKRGKSGDAKVSVSSNLALQTPTRLPEFANSYDYAVMYNEALKNDNPDLSDDQLLFKPIDLQLYQDGTDPIFHPDIDYFDLMMKKTAPQSKSTVSVTGGGEKAKYFISLGYMGQSGLWNEFNKQFNYSNNTTFNRYNFRSSVDFNVSKSTVLGLSLGGFSGKRHTAGNPFSTMMDSSPLTTPVLVGDKIILNDAITSRNSAVTAISTGYDEDFSNQFSLTADLNQKLDALTKGLSFRAKLAYDSEYTSTITKTVTRIRYKPIKTIIDGQETIVYQPLNDQNIGGEIVGDFKERSKKMYFEGALQYDRSFGKHNLGGLILYTQSKQWWKTGIDYPEVPIGYLGGVARLTYNYDYRYLLELSLGRNGSENFPPETRYGTFPAVSAGWNLTREPFVKKILGEDSVFSLLKLRGSYGETGNDAAQGRRFVYFASAYEFANVTRFGEDLVLYQGAVEGQLGNPDITWEKAIKKNLGIEMGFFKDKLNLKVDYFTDLRNNILYSQKVNAHVAAAIQDLYNIAKVENHGYELEMGWQSNIGKVNYWINGNYTFARNKVLANGIPVDPLYPNTSQVGVSQNQTLGLIALGFFKTQEEADAWPRQFSSRSTPGDVKYMDFNGDGAINEKDFSAIGNPTYPEVNFGANMGFSFKGFDINALFQGATNVSRLLSGYMQKPAFQFASTLQSVVGERWTSENMDNAKRPKLTATYANSTNYQNSTLWLRDASYLRLKNIELGYKLTGNFLKTIGVSSARVYVSGQNLLTWDKLKIVDPEQEASNSFKYPQLQVYNAGLSVQF